MTMPGHSATLASAGAASGKPPGADRPIRVMIVDDSAVVRGLVSRWIGEEPGLEVVARHANGRLAVEDVARIAPDIVMLDIEMPVMDGLEALPLLLRAKPGVRVVMASTLTKRNAEISFRALSLGALDYVPKPDSNRGITIPPEFREELIRKLKGLGRRHGRGPRGDRGWKAGRLRVAFRPGPAEARPHSHAGRSLWCCRASSPSAAPPAGFGGAAGAAGSHAGARAGRYRPAYAADIYRHSRSTARAFDRHGGQGGRRRGTAQARHDLCGAWRPPYDRGRRGRANLAPA
jgi:two-component system chemotaxis response regulator CheB